jgi:hypothetical protein
VDGWFRTAWYLISHDLDLAALRVLGYNNVSFKWETYWAENPGDPDCRAHVVLDCADINLYRGDWSYYDQAVNPGEGWKWAIWNFSAPIGTVIDRPNIRCAYGYDKRDSHWLYGLSYYDLSGTVSLTITAVK